MGQLLKRILTSIPLLIGMTISPSLLWRHRGIQQPLYGPKHGVEDQAQIRENLGLDQPIFIQYGKWQMKH